MKYNNILLPVCVGAVLATACADVWDDHYNNNTVAENSASQSLWQMVQDDPDLTQFARVIKATHYDIELNSNQMLTLWAVPIDKDVADSWIETYKTDSLAGVKRSDNRAVVRFVQNHLCQYNRTVSPETSQDTVKMLNGKYKHLSYDNIDGQQFLTRNALATNGVMYKIDQPMDFFSNIYEALGDDDRFSHFTAFMQSFSRYEIDPESSVPGDIVDGKTQYLDSVTYLNNELLDKYDAHITSEDSSYILLAPTNDVWDSLVTRYKKYFRYTDTTPHADSIQELTAMTSVFYSRFFNINHRINAEMAKPDPLSRDSITGTLYTKSAWENFVYYHPFAADGIFGGKESIKCSNGYLYVDDELSTINPKHTFAYNYAYAASNSSLWVYGSDSDEGKAEYNDNDKQKQHKANLVSIKVEDSLLVANTDPAIEQDSIKVPLKVKGDSYMVFSGVSPVFNTTRFSYKLPNLLSGLYYNIYMVCPPAVATEDPEKGDITKPMKFNAYLHELNDEGERGKGIGKNTYLFNLESAKADDQDFVTKAGLIDTLCLMKAHQFNFADDGITDVAWIHFQSQVPNSDFKEGRYTRSMRIGAMILRGYETAEEAEEDYSKYLQSRSSK